MSLKSASMIGNKRIENTEADTCRIFVTPRLQAAGWDNAPHAIHEQRSFTDGRIVFRGGRVSLNSVSPSISGTPAG